MEPFYAVCWINYALGQFRLDDNWWPLFIIFLFLYIFHIIISSHLVNLFNINFTNFFSFFQGGTSKPITPNIDSFLITLNELGLPGFEPSVLEQVNNFRLMQCNCDCKLE